MADDTSMNLPNVKLPSTLSGYFLIIHTILLFIGLIQPNNLVIDPRKMIQLSIVGISIGVIMHYLISPYMEIKYDEKYGWMGEPTASMTEEYLSDCTKYAIPLLIIYLALGMFIFI